MGIVVSNFARLYIFLFVCGLFGSGAFAGDKAYVCTFEDGMSWNFENGAFGDEKTAPLSFRISKIDRSGQSAELTTETGRTDLKLVAALDAMHFIEVTVSGYLNLTTLYAETGTDGRVPAVHSRHLGIVGQPVGGQLKGFCVASDD